MGLFQAFVDELNQAYIQWELEYRQNERLARFALTTWWDGLWARMPEVDWQRELEEFQAEWLERGIQIEDDDAERMRAYLTAWQAGARKRAEEAAARRQSDLESSRSLGAWSAAMQPAAIVPLDHESQALSRALATDGFRHLGSAEDDWSVDKPLPLPGVLSESDWPRLSDADRRHMSERNEAAWWWRNPFDYASLERSLWEREFISLARRARGELWRLFRETESLGRIAGERDEAIDEAVAARAEEAHRRVQAAYDSYLIVLLAIEDASEKYAQRVWLYRDVALVELLLKLDNDLPIQPAPGLSSPYLQTLRQRVQARGAATNAVLRRTEFLTTGLVVADVAITVIEVAAGFGAVKAGARVVAREALERGLSPRAATLIAAKFIARQVAIAAAVQTGATFVLPPILRATGLDEHQIRAGLVMLQAISVARSLRSGPRGRSDSPTGSQKPASGRAASEPSPAAETSASASAAMSVVEIPSPDARSISLPIIERPRRGFIPVDELVASAKRGRSQSKPPFPAPVAEKRWSWSGHRNAALAEEELAKTIHSLPDEVVIQWGDVIGTHGADVVSVNMRTGTVTLWDAKFRSNPEPLKPTKTFELRSRLDYAIEKAKLAIKNQQGLEEEIRDRAIGNLDTRRFRKRTVGAGRAKNSTF